MAGLYILLWQCWGTHGLTVVKMAQDFYDSLSGSQDPLCKVKRSDQMAIGRFRSFRSV